MKFASFLKIVIFLLIFGVLSSLTAAYFFLTRPHITATPELKLFTVSRGDNLFAISKNLKDEGFIHNDWIFNVYILAQRKYNTLQAGTYLLSAASSTKEVADAIIEGDAALVTVTIPEGFTLRQADERLKKLGAVEIFNQRAGEWALAFNFLKDAPENASLEGFLFPDTYHFPYGLNSEGIVRAMLENFGLKFNRELQEEVIRQEKTIFQIITMASLIEKEVNKSEDRRIVSGILWKRIKTGMPLQVDATVAYITGKKTTKISREETAINSPYNTYRYPGLPVGPISNPGMESISAAVYPEDSPYFYYLSAPDGTTIFSRTLEEHNKAKTKYLK